jgi:hypothetical protein
MKRYVKRATCDTCGLSLLLMWRFKNKVVAIRCPAPECHGKAMLDVSPKAASLEAVCDDFDTRLIARGRAERGFSAMMENLSEDQKAP